MCVTRRETTKMLQNNLDLMGCDVRDEDPPIQNTKSLDSLEAALGHCHILKFCLKTLLCNVSYFELFRVCNLVNHLRVGPAALNITTQIRGYR